MVSSFMIQTTIRIPKEVRDEFNDFASKASPYRGETEDSVKVKAYRYFDQGGSDGVDALDYFLSKDCETTGPASNFVDFNNWRADSEGLLQDRGEKFHGAISMLEYLIETFFKPKGIQLNGTVIGVNTEMALAYVYRVKDNVITLDEKETRNYLEIYSFLSDHTDASCDHVFRIMVAEILDLEELKRRNPVFSY